jgi:CRP-like cAMP-binding protein
VALLKDEARKLNKAYLQLVSLSKSTIKKRILACIMMFMEEMGVRVPQGGRGIIRLKNRPTQEQIAGMSGTTRETVNREIAALMENGYIDMDGKDLLLLKEIPLS